MFLRVHNRPKNNDIITRYTYENAIKSKTFATGLELGKTAFALRVVHPFYDNNKQLIGYMEVGEEIDHFFDHMKASTCDDYMVVVDKKYLNEEKWRNAKKNNELMNEWDLHKNEVILTQTTNIISIPKISVDDIPIGGKIVNTNYKVDKKTYILGLLPLIDAGNRKVGAIYFTHEITDVFNKLSTRIFIIILIFLAILSILAVVITVFIKRVVTNPISIVREALDKISHKQIDFQITEKKDDEICELYKSQIQVFN